MEDGTWTLSELAEEVAAVLRGYEAASNGQVRAVPDERAIRYYTTLGLIDRPAAMRGRTALYGKRHLAQVVAIKRLQSAGKPLSEIATIVPTLDDAMLARVSGVAVPRRPAPAATRADFWRREPAQSAAPSAPAAPAGEPARSGPGRTPGRSAPERSAPEREVAERSSDAAPLPTAKLHSRSRAKARERAEEARERAEEAPGAPGFAARLVLELAPGVTIAIDPARAANESDAEAALLAARPLLAELRRRHLINAEAVAPAFETNTTTNDREPKEREEEPR